MASALIEAIKAGPPRTNNGALTLATSGNTLTDLFGTIGSMRNLDSETIIAEFKKALYDDSLDAMRILFYSRDIRGGQGERSTFLTIFNWLCVEQPNLVQINLPLVIEFGRYTDLYATKDTPVEPLAVSLWAKQIQAKDGLACKWAPREKSAHSLWAYKLRTALGMNAKTYRKFLSVNSSTVEQQMCAQNWSEIKYERVPSQAMTKLRKAFGRQDQERFAAFLEDVESGVIDIKAATLHPHEILCKMLRPWDSTGYSKYNAYGYNGDFSYDHDAVLQAQWEALPNYIKDEDRKVLTVVDVSGSMGSQIGKSKARVVDAAIALGIYTGERLTGPFKDHVITFSQEPMLVDFSGQNTLADKASIIGNSPWGMNTDLQATFSLILKRAIEYNIPQDDMPTTILIVSDMEFDCATDNTLTQRQNIANQYATAGYTMPETVWWNVLSRPSNVPVTSHETGAALISGYSPSILEAVLSGESMTPYLVMRKVLDSPRYANVKS